jgi:predicted MPP superfamily phosphohydrolase
MNFEITKYTFYADIPDDVKFIFVSDLHECEIEPILDAVKSAKPHAVLVGGDFVHDRLNYKVGFEFIKRSCSICPTFVSLGNHDLKYGEDIRGEIINRGALLLDNCAASFNGIHIGGLSSCLSEKEMPDTEWLGDFAKLDGFKILLSHRPEYYEKYLREFQIDLTISGHAHGGQWRFFGRGAYAPDQGVFPKYSAGIYDDRLIVSAGAANPQSPIPRIFNPKEILLIHIKSQ